jgi:hypothetical protein
MMNGVLSAAPQSWADKLATADGADALAERFAALLKAEGIEAGVAVVQQHALCMCNGSRFKQFTF